MDLGIALPTSGALAAPENIIRMAREAEQMGYAAVWTYERLLRPVGNIVMRSGGPSRPMSENYGVVYDPLETLTYAAAITDRIKLGTSILTALFHPPVVLARRFATLDQFSGGRAIAAWDRDGWRRSLKRRIYRCSAGSGDRRSVAAYTMLGYKISLIRVVYRVPPSDIKPETGAGQPSNNHRSSAPAGVRERSRISDGLNVIAESLDVVNDLAAQFREAFSEAGRDPATAMIVVHTNGPVTVERLGADRPFLAGAPSQIAEDLASSRTQTLTMCSSITKMRRMWKWKCGRSPSSCLRPTAYSDAGAAPSCPAGVRLGRASRPVPACSASL